jgi:adenosine deaminase
MTPSRISVYNLATKITMKRSQLLNLFSLRNRHALIFAIAIVCVPVIAQTVANSASRVSTTSEQRAESAFNSARNNPLELRAFLVRMPKGADLHMHLTGAVYAESWIHDGAADNLCVNLAQLAFTVPDSMSAATPPTPNCHDGSVPIAQAFTDQHLYDAIVDALSMRTFVPATGESAHDHFFATFSKFHLVEKSHIGDWLDEVSARAAAQNEQYLEIMDTPDFSHTADIARKIGWQTDFAAFRNQLLAQGLQSDIDAAQKEFDGAESSRRKLENCGQPNESIACKVQTRFLFQALRGYPKEQVFAQLLVAFETASADPNVVGVNFVMPEDGFISMRDYNIHMQIFNFMHSMYPNVHVSLHAGEIAPGVVPYEGLCCHVRGAVEQGHAERIGHGVDVMFETNPQDLLKEMATKHVMVEINLTSNDVILGVAGANHPFPLYRKFGVPVALSSDDEGVSRIDLTHEFVRAVQTYNLSYPDLKKLVRTSVEHSFLPGPSLWRAPDDFRATVSPCSRERLGSAHPADACANFLHSSARATQQWELERRFAAFESSI